MIVVFELTINNSRDYNIWKNHLISFHPISLVNLGYFYNISKQIFYIFLFKIFWILGFMCFLNSIYFQNLLLLIE